MSEMFDRPHKPAVRTHGLREITGRPQPGLEEAVDGEIYKLMVEQRREINKRNLPDLD